MVARLKSQIAECLISYLGICPCKSFDRDVECERVDWQLDPPSALGPDYREPSDDPSRLPHTPRRPSAKPPLSRGDNLPHSSAPTLSPSFSFVRLLILPRPPPILTLHNMSSVIGFLWDTFFAKLQYNPTPNLLTGRTVIVTGSNVGLGFETAVHLGKLDPKLLIIACRNLDKGNAARDKVIARTGLGPERVEVWQLDLADFASVKAFANRVDSDLDRLDILCQNAGVATSKFSKTKDGFETTVQVNGLSTGLLALLTLPLVAKTATLPLEAGQKPFKPHSTIVGSEGQPLPISFDPVHTGILTSLHHACSARLDSLPAPRAWHLPPRQPVRA